MKLESYLGGEVAIPSPHMSSQKIQRILEARRKRWLLIALSFAAMLWLVVLVMITVWIHRLNPVAAYVISGLLGVGLMSSGAFSGLVLKFKKVGVEI